MLNFRTRQYRKLAPPANSNSASTRQRLSRRLGLESLEPRQLLTGTPANPHLHIVDDATANLTYRYAANGSTQGSSALVAANAAPRGAASMIGVDRTWVIDASRKVFVYDSGGGLLGSWTAGSMPSNATPEGIATNGTDVWIVDAKSDKVYHYVGAASRVAGGQNAASNFSLYAANWAGVANTSPKDVVTDGSSLWVVDDGKADRVFKYDLAGGLLAYWTIDSANKTPTGIAIDPANVGDIWISDSGTDRVYRYAAATRSNIYNGSQAATSSFALTAGNGNAQGIAVAGRLWVEAPYQVEWVRQLGSAGNDFGRGVSADSLGNVYLSGWSNGSLAAPNPTGGNAPFLARFDSDGAFQWAIQEGVGREGVRVATDGQGNVFAPRGDNEGDQNSTMNKYDASGALLWSTPIPLGQLMYGVTVDSAGNAYGAGMMMASTQADVVLRKFDGQSGSIVWEHTLITGAATNASGISADGLGNIYVLGHTGSSVIGPNAGPQDAFVAKYTEDGDFQWAKQFGTAGTELAFSVRADGFGNVYAGGTTTGAMGGPNAGDADFFLTKFDLAGNVQWTRQWGTSGGASNGNPWTDSLGNVYLAGSANGSVGGPGLGAGDIVVSKFSPSGNMLWSTQIGTNGDEVNSGGISGDDQGNLYIAGRTTGSWGATSAGGYDAVLIKISPPVAASSGTARDNAADTSALNSDLAFAAIASHANPSRSVRAKGAIYGASSTPPSVDAGRIAPRPAWPAAEVQLVRTRNWTPPRRADLDRLDTFAAEVDAAIAEDALGATRRL